MPTPESASFLAKKPTVAPTYEGVDFDDNVAVHNARDAIIREQWVRSMMSRLVGEELGKCYHREGVNHMEKCGVLRGEFFSFFFLSFGGRGGEIGFYGLYCVCICIFAMCVYIYIWPGLVD